MQGPEVEKSSACARSWKEAPLAGLSSERRKAELNEEGEVGRSQLA